MASTKWTNDQLTAINTRQCNLLVAAAAGSGKTAVLVERLIRIITNPEAGVDVDRLLVVTFTKAAAAEMRERIGAAIVKELDKHPGSRHLLRQITLINKAAITNLHSFCLDIIRQYFYHIELDPAFRVIDDTEAELIRLEILEELFEARYASDNNIFTSLVDSYGGYRDDSNLQEMVLKLYHFSVSNPWPKEWLRQVADNYSFAETDIDKHLWGKALKDWLILQLESFRANLIQAIKLAQSPGGPISYLSNLQEDLTLIDDLINSSTSWQKLFATFNIIEFGKLNTCPKDVDELLKGKVKKLRDGVKKGLNSLREAYFSRPPSEYLNDIKKMSPLISELTQLVIDFNDKYRLAKVNKSLLDFADLEHYCLQILLDQNSTPDNLIPSTVALELRDKFIEVLVDEYQDINAVQETILNLLSQQGTAYPNLFMVGDVKQSIYRFRLAEPGLFMDKYHNYPREAGHNHRSVDLAKNFRSRREILSAVNFIFRQLMTPRIGEMAYDEKAELVYGANYLDNSDINTVKGPVELHLLEKKTESSDSFSSSEAENESEQNDVDDPFDLDAIQREARLVAAKINTMVNGSDHDTPMQIFDKYTSQYRPVTYQDIVILTRTTRGIANTYMEEFRLLGIPAYADLNSGYFDATEVETMLSLLKIIDNPHQDIPLAAVLRSPIVGLNAEELAIIRVLSPETDFYTAMKNFAQSADIAQIPLRQKIIDFLELLEIWRSIARKGSLANLIWKLYTDTGFYAYVGGMPGGAQRQANLRALHDRSRQYEKTNFRGLFRFLRFIEKLQDNGNDLGTARALGENENVVRIISIHKSKGLEFPVVIVVSLGKQFNTTDLRNTAIIHKELGVGLPVVDTNLRVTYPSLIQEAIKKRHMMELMAEEMRVLYVALTRAKEKLILIGSVNNINASIIKWCENISSDSWPLPDTKLAGAKSFLDWIVPAVARHQDGQCIRQLASAEPIKDNQILIDPSNWQVFIWPPGNYFTPINQEDNDNLLYLEKIASLETIPTDKEFAEDVNRRLSWQYPYESLIGKGAKVAVTEVKGRFSETQEEEEFFPHYRPSITKRPLFLQKTPVMTAAERGSAMHLVMQHLDFIKAISIENIREQLTELQTKELLTQEQYNSIDISKIDKFIHSELGMRLRNANTVLKELPFTLALPVTKIYSEIKNISNEQVLIQGVIDCLFIDEKGLVLLDYKTDQINAGTNINTLSNRYSGQLNIYATAIETIVKKPVTEKYLYLFDNGTSVLMD